MVSNPNQRAMKLPKTCHNQWLGHRPTVQKVTMNPIHHPHYEDEDRSKSSGFGKDFSNPTGLQATLLMQLYKLKLLVLSLTGNLVRSPLADKTATKNKQPQDSKSKE
ncbi:Ribosomal protein [Trema orientale]|uniref:Ribosomal protein n=1 Tax=Trema orientale TaxID=63057 RepID=A0A2P5AWT7_TREOI|nr:Ribosomal protein [Trema orientale]